jgi:hypothetical protein
MQGSVDLFALLSIIPGGIRRSLFEFRSGSGSGSFVNEIHESAYPLVAGAIAAAARSGGPGQNSGEQLIALMRAQSRKQSLPFWAAASASKGKAEVVISRASPSSLGI